MIVRPIMSTPTPEPSEDAASRSRKIRNPTHAFTVSTRLVPPSTTAGHANPTRLNARDSSTPPSTSKPRSNILPWVYQHRVSSTIPLSKSSASSSRVSGSANKLGVMATKLSILTEQTLTEASKEDTQRENTSANELGHTRTSSRPTSETERPMIVPPTQTEEPMSILKCEDSMSDSPHDSASIASSCPPGRLRHQVSNLSRSFSGSIPRVSLLSPLSPAQVETAPVHAQGEMQQSLNRSSPLSSLRGHVPTPVPAKALRSVEAPSTTEAHAPKLVEPQTSAKPLMSRSTSRASLTKPPTPDRPELKHLGSVVNWAGRSLNRRSTVSGAPPRVVLSRRSSRGSVNDDIDFLRERERKWGTGLPVAVEPQTAAKPLMSRSTSRASLTKSPTPDRPELKHRNSVANCAGRRLDRRSTISGPSAPPRAALSRRSSRGSVNDDIDFFRERERKWGTGLHVPGVATCKMSEDNLRRRSSLSRLSGETKPLNEPSSDVEKRLNWGSRMARAVAEAKMEMENGSSIIPKSSSFNLTPEPEPRPSSMIPDRAFSPSKASNSEAVNELGTKAAELSIATKKTLTDALQEDTTLPPTRRFATNSTISLDGDLSPILNLESASEEDLSPFPVTSPRLQPATIHSPIAPPEEKSSSPPVPIDVVQESKITTDMPLSDVLLQLNIHGCKDITQYLDKPNCNKYPERTGGFGEVYQGALQNRTKVSLKILRTTQSNGEKKLLKHTARELYVWSKCKHPNILELIGMAQFRNKITMVSPWMENGNLKDFLPKYPKLNRCEMCLQIADSISYLHSEGVVHGDIKGANILVSHDFIPKLADFGNAAWFDKDTPTLRFETTTSKSSMSLRWAPPEIVMGPVRLSFNADIHSLGMTILEVITGSPPYGALHEAAIYGKIITNEPPERPESHIPYGVEQADHLWSLLTRCWNSNPDDRPSASKVREEMKTITPKGLMRTFGL